MNYTLFFEKNDQLAFTFLQQFTANREQIVPQATLLNVLPLSEYKLTQLLHTLNQDLAAVQSTADCNISFIDKTLLCGHNITTTVIHEIRLMYLKRSVLFALFNYNLLTSNRETKETFRKNHFISKTKFYATQLQLRDILNQSDFYQSSSMINDPEYTIRLRLFEFFYIAFNGVGSPFPELDTQINNFIVTVQANLKLVIKPIQRVKLAIFIKVWLLRVLNKHPLTMTIIPDNNITNKVKERLADIKSAAEQLFSLKLTVTEMNYFYSFLVTQQYLPGIETYLDQANFPLAYQLTDHLMTTLLADNVFVSPATFDTTELRTTLTKTHLRFTTFYVESTTFISFDQINFFQETYPLFHTIIKRFIQQLADQQVVHLSQRDANNLYFDYMFTLITTIPANQLHDKIFVCVDFSQGELYTNYVIKTLQGFNNAKLVIETSLSPNTDLYLSDFYTSTIKQSQIIWRNPPTPDDWTELGDVIVRIKHAKNQPIINSLQGQPVPKPR